MDNITEDIIQEPNGTEVELTKEEQELLDREILSEIFMTIMKGIRPEGMPYEDFKKIRTQIRKNEKKYLEGKVFWPARYFKEKDGKVDYSSYWKVESYSKELYNKLKQNKEE